MFEWMGSELGVFAHQAAQPPVFFIALKDAAKCHAQNRIKKLREGGTFAAVCR